MPDLNLIESINFSLKQEMSRDDSVVVLGEDVGVEGGVFRATDGLQKMFGIERVIDTPLSESGIVGVSIGMALYGLKPVAEIQFMGFLFPALDQLFSHAARYRNRSRGGWHLPMVVRMPYCGGIKAPEHHSESTEALLAHIPGLKVVIPSNPSDAKGLLASAIRDPDPVIFLEPERLYRAWREDVAEEDYTIPLGKANVLTEGKDLTLIGWGAMIPVCKKAMEEAKQKGYSVELIDVRTISPCDFETIIESVKKTGRAIIVHEATKTGGFGAEISARINEEALLSLEAPVERVTGYDIVVPLGKKEDWFLPNAKRVMKAIEKTMNF